MKYYAVRKGRKPGIYTSWDECRSLVTGFKGAEYKSFTDRASAEKYMAGGSGIVSSGTRISGKGGFGAVRSGTRISGKGGSGTVSSGTRISGKRGSDTVSSGTRISGTGCSDAREEESESYSFVDGSFNLATGVYGYGGFLVHNGEKYILSGNGNDPEMASMRNVAGEVLGSTAAVEKALELGITKLDIYYDYMGISAWATGDWKRNKKGTIAYHDYIQSVKDKISLRFVKVKGHSGVEGNEEADRLAKQAVGILH